MAYLVPLDGCGYDRKYYCKTFDLSHSTGCGCCSHQVSSISVLWVTCHEHFYVFHGSFIFNFINTSKDSTHYGGYSYKFSWSLMKGIQNYFKSPLFRFHGNCGKICPTNSNCFGLSSFTGCGCCSYQVSSISVLRITCYEYFCVFHGNFIFNFINTSKDSTHYGEYSYDVSWSLMKEIKKYKQKSPFLFPWQLRQRLSYRFR